MHRALGQSLLRFELVHEAEWGVPVDLSDRFSLYKEKTTLEDVVLSNQYDIIYFDAFAPGVQPELWTREAFDKLLNAMSKGGIFTTYSSKGAVRRLLIEVGFEVEKIPGPPGKREMLRATKV